MRPPAPTCRILHVNDSEPDHQALTKLLHGDRSFCVERAHSGIEALQQLRSREHLPNLVIVTWNFAQMACAEFIDQMKSEKRLAVIPIIVIASSILPEEVMQAYDAGAACVLRKGSDIESLTEALRSLKHFWSLVILPFCNPPTTREPKLNRKTGDAEQASRSFSAQRSAQGKKAATARWAKAKTRSESSDE